MSGRNPRAGVTLLETMIALLVMAMVAMLLSTGLGGSARFLKRSAEGSDLVQQAVARRDLRRWLEHALPAPVPGDERPIFFGSTAELTFLAVPPGDIFWPGNATQISIASQKAEAHAEGIDFGRKGPVTVTLRLAPQGNRLVFRYWGRTTADEDPAWHASWPMTAGIPDLIRLELSGDGSVPPPLVVRPGKAWLQSEMSLSSLVPPALPSRP